MPAIETPAGNTDGLPEIDGLSEYINLVDGLGRIRGNRKAYKTFLNSFIKNISLEQLDQELREGRLEDAAKTVHGIKGVCANLSLVAAARTSAELEALLKAGVSGEKAFGELAAALGRTKELAAELTEKL